MHLHAQRVDDLLRKVFERLLKSKSRVTASKGPNREIYGVLLELKNPRARLSRAESRSIVFSCIGEFLWYMSGRDDVDFVKYYVGKKYEEFAEPDGTIHGAYGPRIFKKDGIDQLSFVLNKLHSKPDSRNALIQLFDARDTQGNYKDIPCTCTLQFVLRNGHLHMHTHMRSNDAFLGLPHDIFCFTMLQEVIGVTLGAKLGVYTHSVASLHLYDENAIAAQEFLNEGLQDDVPMPPMPSVSPIDQINHLLKIEQALRDKAFEPSSMSGLDDYWADWARLLRIKAARKNSKIIKQCSDEMASDVYATYIRKRHKAANKSQSLNQPLLPEIDAGSRGKS